MIRTLYVMQSCFFFNRKRYEERKERLYCDLRWCMTLLNFSCLWTHLFLNCLFIFSGKINSKPWFMSFQNRSFFILLILTPIRSRDGEGRSAKFVGYGVRLPAFLFVCSACAAYFKHAYCHCLLVRLLFVCFVLFCTFLPLILKRAGDWFWVLSYFR